MGAPETQARLRPSRMTGRGPDEALKAQTHPLPLLKILDSACKSGL